MARGNNQTIANNTGVLINTLSRDVRATALVLNPNDGILYVVLNQAAAPQTWDFVVPSQSYAALPGPWESLGLFYVDQSGANRSGNITVYESDQRLDVPIYQAVGIARLAQATSLDITEGPQPANPGAGIARLWTDVNGFVHILDSTGTDRTVWDSSKFHTIGNLAAQPTLASDAWNNAGMASGYNAITNFGSFAFTTYIANSIVLAVIKASVQIVFPPTATQAGFNLVVDTLHHRLPRRNFPTTLQDYVGGGTVVLQAMNTGAHTAQLYLYSSAAVASGFYLRGASAPEGEFCQVSIFELMGVGT